MAALLLVLVPLVSAAGARTARAQEADPWAATLEALTVSPFFDAAVPPDAFLDDSGDGAVPGGQSAVAAGSVATPVLSPNTGIFDAPVRVRCRTATPTAVIRYTTNGAVPTNLSPVCKGSVVVRSTTLLRMRAFRAGLLPSKVSKATIMVAAPAVGDTRTFQVQWTSQTTLVDKSQFAMLTRTDARIRRYVFNKTLADTAGVDLSVGRVLVIYGIDFGTIATSTVAGNSVTVTLASAKLSDAISDGVIDWDFAVPLSADRVQFVTPAGPVLALQPAVGAAAAQPVVIKFKNGQFDYEITASLVGTAADLTIAVSKELVSKVVSRYTVQAHLEGYRAQNHLQVAAGQLTDWNSDLNGLKGDATLKLVVAGSGNDLNYQFPFTVMKVPFLIGPIPASLNIGAKFVVNASVPFDGSAGVETKFTYDSDLGLAYAGSTMNYSATLAGYTIGDPPAQPYAASSGQIGANFGIGFPEIGLAIGAGVEAGAWFRPAFVVGASFTAYNSPIPNCVSSDATFLGVVGYDVTVFGFECSLLSGSKTVFQYTKPLRRSGQCPP